jgi:hypothetical protein
MQSKLPTPNITSGGNGFLEQGRQTRPVKKPGGKDIIITQVRIFTVIHDCC